MQTFYKPSSAIERTNQFNWMFGNFYRHAPDNKCGAGKEMSLRMYAFVPEEGWRCGKGREFGCTLVVLNSFILACLEVGLITDERTSQTFVRVSWLSVNTN